MARVIINKEQVEMLLEHIQNRCVDLEKVASNLMKKKLVDAATPVYAEIKRLQKMQTGLKAPAPEEIEK